MQQIQSATANLYAPYVAHGAVGRDQVFFGLTWKVCSGPGKARAFTSEA